MAFVLRSKEGICRTRVITGSISGRLIEIKPLAEKDFNKALNTCHTSQSVTCVKTEGTMQILKLRLLEFFSYRLDDESVSSDEKYLLNIAQNCLNAHEKNNENCL